MAVMSEDESVDFEALGAEILSGMGKLRLLESSSGWNAIVLPVTAMPGTGVAVTVASLFSGRPVSMEEIGASLGFLKLAVVESSETDGGAALDDLSFGEWLELLEQWSNGQ